MTPEATPIAIVAVLLPRLPAFIATMIGAGMMIARRDRLLASPYLAAFGFFMIGIVNFTEPVIYILLQSIFAGGPVSALTRILGYYAVIQGILSCGSITLLIIAFVRRPSATQVP